MRLIQKLLLTFFLIFSLSMSASSAYSADDTDVNIYFFWGYGCPHCEKEKFFLNELEQKNPNVTVYDFEITKNAENRRLLNEIANRLDITVSGVPFTVIGENFFAGYFDDESTGKAIEDAVRCAQSQGCEDVGRDILLANGDGEERSGTERSAIPEKVKVPILGEVSIKNFSLPLLTIVLGALDGFNPCAMWALVFLISLLIGMENKRRMWILGSAFIITSAFVYFLFMVAWLNLILFVGLVSWVRILIGLIALAGGGYNLKEYFTNKDATCKVTGNQKRQKFFEKLKNISKQKSFYLALGGIILLAFAVNLVELVCSAGLPAVYTQVLALSDLPVWQYYLYILLYVFVFMLDDLLVFIIAMTTLRLTGLTTKYSRWSHLIGGILMIIIGLLLIFRPELLMFG